MRDRTRVPCIGRWILNHCATTEAQGTGFDIRLTRVQIPSSFPPSLPSSLPPSLHRVLVAAHGIFIEVRGIFCCGARALHCGAVLLSSCGMRVFLSLVVARVLQGAWAL